MVWFWYGQDYGYSFVLEMTIQKLNQYIRIQDGVKKSHNNLKTEPFATQQLRTSQNLNMFGIRAPHFV